MTPRIRRLNLFDVLFDVRTIGLILGLLAAGSALYGYQRLHGTFDLLTLIGDFYANVSAELGSIAITVLIVDRLNQRRENRDLARRDAERRAEEARREEERREDALRQLKEQLVREAGSPIHATAVTAVDTIRKRGWLGRKNMVVIPDDTESLLQKADLSRADLHESDLSYADLSGADLSGVDLRGAFLANTNLSGAFLYDADLSGANLHGARLTEVKLRGADLTSARLENVNLVGADLGGANLTGVSLRGADLTGADAWESNLSDAHLGDANLTSADFGAANLSGTIIQSSTQFDEKTRLPDGSNWKSGRDLAEFGADRREITESRSMVDEEGYTFYIYTLADGTKRRWQIGKGWLDDREGNPLT
jgi:uncharacterized protein YjbI with pentapeptide repeats